MSALQWTDWSCTVRVVLADGRPAQAPPAEATAARAERLVRALMDDVAAAVSRFRDDSDLARANAAAGRLVDVAPLTLDLVSVALDAARTTRGACDPTVGRQVLAAGYDADIDVVRRRDPRSGGLEEPAAAADWRGVALDRDRGRLGVPAGTALDLGATAKAWTADRAAERLTDDLGVPVLVGLGGDLAARATEGHHTWPVRVSEREGGVGPVVHLHGGGLATSSTTGRTWRTSAGQQHHLVDPRTGRPTVGRYRTATVLASTCLEANTWSTAVLATGHLPDGARARLVTTDGRTEITPAWPLAADLRGAA